MAAPPPPPPRPILYDNVGKAMFFARVSKELKRYEDLVAAMESVAVLNGEKLVVDAKIWLDSGYRNLMEAKRNDRKVLELIKGEEAQNGYDPRHYAWIFSYIDKVEAEMDKICTDAKTIIDEYVLPYATSSVDQVSYHMMLGDLYKYRSELKVGCGWFEAASVSGNEYQMAHEIALREIPDNNQLGLCLAVDFSELCSDILDLPKRALNIIRAAVDAASATGELDEECMRLMKMLKDKDAEIRLRLLRDELSGDVVPEATGGNEGAAVSGDEVAVATGGNADGSEAAGKNSGNADGSEAAGKNGGNEDGSELAERKNGGNEDGSEAAGKNSGINEDGSEAAGKNGGINEDGSELAAGKNGGINEDGSEAAGKNGGINEDGSEAAGKNGGNEDGDEVPHEGNN